MRGRLETSLLALGSLLWALFGLLPSVASAIPEGEDGRALRGVAEALGEARVEDAARALGPLAERHPNDPDVLFERAMLRFYRGSYEEAVRDLDAAEQHERQHEEGHEQGHEQGQRRRHLRSEEERSDMQALIRATARATSRFERHRSSDGRYEVRYAPGPDAILVPYVEQTLRAAEGAIRSLLGVRHPGPIRLEIYPTAASLASVSSLTVEEIGRTGTIALCKWDRLMITSPRALVRGYPWMDTIAHEFVHLMLTRASRDRAPVWLQEGMAKLLERRWRDPSPTAPLHPTSLALLDSAVRSDGLLPFDRLHPSIARLPSQRDAALAFAQVATFMEIYLSRYGQQRLRSAIAAIAGGRDAREALAEAAEVPFSRLEEGWRRNLRERPSPSTPAPRLIPLRLRAGGGSGEGQAGREEADDTQGVAEEARRFLRLGDLLWRRGRPRAAAVEYGRAFERSSDDPILASRLARASLLGGDAQRAIEVLTPMRERYPDHAPTWAVLGAAYARLGRRSEARQAIDEALRLNPFDPQPHCDLAEIAEEESAQDLERGTCRRLGGPRFAAPSR